MAVVTVRTELAAPAEGVWCAVGTPEAFVHVARPVLRFPAAERHGRPWGEGVELSGWIFLAWVVPLGRHHLRIAALDHDRRRLVSEEHGGLVRRWDHVIEVRDLDEGRSAYLDEIVLEAGPLTPLVAGFAHLFYRHRQRRWRALAPVLAAVSSPGR